MEPSSQGGGKLEGGGMIKGALDRISPRKKEKKARKKSGQSAATTTTTTAAAADDSSNTPPPSHRTFLGGALKNAADKVAQGSQDALRAVAAGTHKATAALTPGGGNSSSSSKWSSDEGLNAAAAAAAAAATQLPPPSMHLEGSTTPIGDAAAAAAQTQNSRDETVDTASETTSSPTTTSVGAAAAAPSEADPNAETLVIVGLAVDSDDKGGGGMTSPASSKLKALVSDAETALHQAVKPILETSKEVASTVAQGSGDFFKAAVIQPVTRDIPHLKERISKKKKSQGGEPSDEAIGDGVDLSAAVDDTAAVPPDETLERMELLFTRKLRGVSIREWYETCWSEGNRTDRPPFYGPWLVSSGKKDIVVGEWEFGSDQEDTAGDGSVPSPDPPPKIVNAWDQQEYQQRRTVTFRSDTNSAHVTHTQYCRVEGGQDAADDRCVVAFAVTMKGIPFADAFSVHIRWVATRTRAGNLLAQVGLFVEFARQVLVAGQIRSNTTKQTTLAQLDLFRAMSEVLGCQEGQEEEGDKVEPASVGQATSSQPGWLQQVQDLFRICLPDAESRVTTLELSRLRSLLQKVQRLDPPPESCDSMYALGELEAAHEALTSFLVGLIHGESGILSATPAQTDLPLSPTPSPKQRNPLQVLVLDPIQKLLHFTGGSASSPDDSTVAVSESTDTVVEGSGAASRSVAVQDEPPNDLLSLVEDCLHRCWTKGSAWVDRDAELGRNVRWLDAKIRAAELLMLEVDERTADSMAPRIAAASESLVHIIEWHQAHRP